MNDVRQKNSQVRYSTIIIIIIIIIINVTYDIYAIMHRHDKLTNSN